MKATEICFTRVLSDRNFGNYAATVRLQVEEGDHPADVLAEVRYLAIRAVTGQLPIPPSVLDPQGQVADESDEPVFCGTGEALDPDDDSDDPLPF